MSAPAIDLETARRGLATQPFAVLLGTRVAAVANGRVAETASFWIAIGDPFDVVMSDAKLRPRPIAPANHAEVDGSGEVAQTEGDR